MDETVVTMKNGVITSIVSNGKELPSEQVNELENKVENGKVAAINETENNQPPIPPTGSQTASSLPPSPPTSSQTSTSQPENGEVAANSDSTNSQPENSQQVNSQTSTSQQVNSQPTTSNGELEKLITNLIIFLNAIKNQYKQKLFSAQDISKIKTVVMKLQTLPGYNELFNPAFFSLLFVFFTMETFHDPLNIFKQLKNFVGLKDNILKFLKSETSNNGYTKLENVLSEIIKIINSKRKDIYDILPDVFKIAISKIPNIFLSKIEIMLEFSNFCISFAIQFLIECIQFLPLIPPIPPVPQISKAIETTFFNHTSDATQIAFKMAGNMPFKIPGNMPLDIGMAGKMPFKIPGNMPLDIGMLGKMPFKFGGVNKTKKYRYKTKQTKNNKSRYNKRKSYRNKRRKSRRIKPTV